MAHLLYSSVVAIALDINVLPDATLPIYLGLGPIIVVILLLTTGVAIYVLMVNWLSSVALRACSFCSVRKFPLLLQC